MVEFAVEWVVDLLNGSVALTISAVMLYKYIRGRRLHHLLWALGLVFWGISSFGQSYAILIGWTVPIYKLYYFSAIAVTGYLGAGTLGLIMPKRRVFPAFLAYIVAVSSIFAIIVALATVDEGQLATAIVGGLAFPGSVRTWTPFITIPGSIAFVGGAALTLVRTRKLFALLITLGALSPAIGGTLARFELPFVLPFSNLFGILLLSAGVYLSTRAAESLAQDRISETPS